MGKAGAHPRGGPVTGVAGFAGDHVIRRLALGDVVVMALSALAGCYTGMTEAGNTPRRRRAVTLFARLGSHEVI